MGVVNRALALSSPIRGGDVVKGSRGQKFAVRQGESCPVGGRQGAGCLRKTDVCNAFVSRELCPVLLIKAVLECLASSAVTQLQCQRNSSF